MPVTASARPPRNGPMLRQWRSRKSDGSTAAPAVTAARTRQRGSRRRINMSEEDSGRGREGRGELFVSNPNFELRYSIFDVRLRRSQLEARSSKLEARNSKIELAILRLHETHGPCSRPVHPRRCLCERRRGRSL